MGNDNLDQNERLLSTETAGVAGMFFSLFMMLFGWVFLLFLFLLWIGLTMDFLDESLWKALGAFVGLGMILVAGVHGNLKRIEDIIHNVNLDSVRSVTQRLAKRYPGFSSEKFIHIIHRKLLRLFDTNGPKQIASCDISGFLRDHADVVKCEILDLAFHDLCEETDYMYLDVFYKVKLHRNTGKSIKRKKQTIYLQLARPLQGIMEADLYEDWSIVKAESRKRKVEIQKHGE